MIINSRCTRVPLLQFRISNLKPAMKITLLFVLVGFFAVTGTLASDDFDDAKFMEAWTKFKTDYHRQYKDEAEEKMRLEIFKATYNKVMEHNKKFKDGLVTWEMTINNYSDKTPQEIRDQLLGK